MKNLPQGWTRVSLGSATAATRLGGNYKCDGAYTGIPVIKMGNLGRGSIQLESVERMPESTDYHADDVLRFGDILFNTRNTLDLVGKVAMWREELPRAVFNSNILRIDFDHKRGFTSGFANLALNCRYALKQLRAIATGTTSVAAIYWRDAQRIRLLRPPLPEQVKIAAIVTEWDKAIQISSGVLSAKLEYKRGLMQQLLTGKKRFKEFKGEKWRKVRIGDLLEPMNRYEEWDDSRVFRLAGVRRNGRGLFHRDELLGSEIKVKICKKICTGDFLISRRQMAYGGMAMVPAGFDGYDVNDEYEVLVVRRGVEFDMRFFDYLSQTPALKHAAYVASNGFFAERLRLNLDLDQFLAHRIAIPPSGTELNKILRVLDTASLEIELLEKQLEALKEQKRGLMQKLLTGEIRVKVNAARGVRNAELKQEETENTEEKK